VMLILNLNLIAPSTINLKLTQMNTNK